MIKRIDFHTRRPHLTVEAFQARWRDVHGPLMARTPGLRRYVQSHPLPELYGTAYHPAFDGVAEMWFDDLDAYHAAVASDEWRAGGPDAREFIAPGSKRLLAAEAVLIDGVPSARERRSMVRYLGFLTRKEGMTVADFQHHWRRVHGPLVIAGLPGMRRYVQSHALPETYGTADEPAYDGVPEAWFDGWDAYPTWLGHNDLAAQATRPSTADSANYVIPGPNPSLIAREAVILG